MGRRRAASLIEMLVAMLFIPLTLATVVFSLTTVQRADRKLIERMETQRATQRLALALREDCRACSVASVGEPDDATKPDASKPDSKRLLVLRRTDGSHVEYSFGAGQVERRVRRGETLAHHDSHRIGEHWFAEAAVVEGPPRMVQLRILPLGPRKAGPIERTLEFAVLAGERTSQPRRRPRRLVPGLARRRRRIGRSRRGVLLVVALVGLLVVGLFASAAFQRAIAGRGESRVRARQWQSEWLADSAVRRASARLAIAPTYRGETWRVELGATAAGASPVDAGSPSPVNAPAPRSDAGEAVILVEPSAEDARRLRVTITARYPADEINGIQTLREFTLPLPPTGDSP